MVQDVIVPPADLVALSDGGGAHGQKAHESEREGSSLHLKGKDPQHEEQRQETLEDRA